MPIAILLVRLLLAVKKLVKEILVRKLLVGNLLKGDVLIVSQFKKTGFLRSWLSQIMQQTIVL